MTPHSIRPVILCGGTGTRLWPVSRKSMPKQFSRLNNDLTMLQDTVRRLEDAGCGAPIFVTNEEYRFTVAAQAEEIGLRGHHIIIEPAARNTAPAISAAAEWLFKEDPHALMLVAPSDHTISDNLGFADAISRGVAKAKEGAIVTFGVRPTQAETGYGYIELHKTTALNDEVQVFRGFIEKPEFETAQDMVSSGNFLWNSGMFLFSVAAIRKTFGQTNPEIRAAVRKSVREATLDLDFIRLGSAFAAAPNIAFDYAVMEHIEGWVVPMTVGWSDLGSWRSVWNEIEQDESGVALHGTARALDCKNSLLFSNDDAVQLVGVGLKNIVAVATRDAVLVTDLESCQSVSLAVTTLRAENLKQADEFTRCERPWGHYESLALGGRFQVKSIVVKPGGQLSLQSHVHRAEHWVVVEGTATVTIGREEKLLTENQSVYIPLGEIHRLANNGKLPLQLIEVQTGSYLGEDDILRYEDIYARN